MSAMSDTSYRRPKTTLQDKLTYDEIKEKLKNYEKVENIVDIPLYTHLRYIEVKEVNGKKEYKFRLGGYLINKENSDKYVVLSNGQSTWSVQVKDTIFYRKLDSQEIMDKFNDQIDELNDKLIKYKIELGRLRKILDKSNIKY
jgi:hypothetical protein